MAKQQVTTKKTIEETSITTICTIEERTLPIIEIIEGKVFCTSLQVALSYKKEHFNVLRDIETHIDYIKNSSRHAGKEADMYLRGFYEVEAGFGKVKKTMYYLNRSGFVKLIANYQGLEASDTTMDYFEAFDKMEAMLLSMRGMSDAPVQYLSNAQVQELKQRVKSLVKPIWIEQSYINTIWNRLRFVANAESQATFRLTNTLH
ncbi:Rha family transcriptional regulator [uncultured Thiothrix sp.]|uniref:Rha family transcriptional regulator n=1 Tax=uncultured Thiothrix sp. TaxID=223185 RepID=UPI00261A4E8B|nr:Rha family transcriptional regulator [uncultured Thiothrix sp.]HMT95002.1 Rha family transcriptional regulator [Thiolinea sp.]